MKAQIHNNAPLDYYSFGMLMPGRSYSSTAYKYGFNGKEKDDEIYGEGNLKTAEPLTVLSRLPACLTSD